MARERRRPDDDAVNGDYSSRDAEIEALKATVARLQLQGDKRRQKFLQREHQLQTAYEAQKREVDDLTARVRDQEALALAPSKPVQKKRPAVREAQTPVADKDAEPPWRPVRGREGLRERRLGDGSREVAYRNGTTKRVDADGTCVVRFANGDVKTSEPSGATIYYYAAADTTHTTDPRRRVEVFEFPNGQVEGAPADSAKDIAPDGTTKTVACGRLDVDAVPRRGRGGGGGAILVAGARDFWRKSKTPCKAVRATARAARSVPNHRAYGARLSTRLERTLGGPGRRFKHHGRATLSAFHRFSSVVNGWPRAVVREKGSTRGVNWSALNMLGLAPTFAMRQKGRRVARDHDRRRLCLNRSCPSGFPWTKSRPLCRQHLGASVARPEGYRDDTAYWRALMGWARTSSRLTECARLLASRDLDPALRTWSRRVFRQE